MATDNLFLILKKEWFDLIAAGIKLEEYREIKPYWIKRFCDTNIHLPFVYCKLEKCCPECFQDNPKNYKIRHFDTVTFQLGYQKHAPRMTFKIKEIVISQGEVSWGAENSKDYFVIRLADRIE